MKDPMIVLDVFGKRAEMTEKEGREMLRLLKGVLATQNDRNSFPRRSRIRQ